MSELTNAQTDRRNLHWHLLTTVSALALLASVNMRDAKAADGDADHPLVWIELGGQLEAITGQGDLFTTPFMSANVDSPAFQPVSPLEAEKAPRYGFGAEGKILFEPDGTDWVFSAAVRYGRANGNKQVHEQTPGIKFPTTSLFFHYGIHSHYIDKFAETNAELKESHVITDFQAGKDVGFGMFGTGSTSIVSLGVRFAQFSSKSSVTIHARPDLVLSGTDGFRKYFHTYALAAHSARSFRGVGPSLSWNASAPLFGNPQDGDLTLDWGANVAALFGRQKASIQHQTTGRAYVQKYGYKQLYQHTGDHNRMRSVTVPNVGGFAGVSYRFADAALSLGYRADFFFGAVDGGIDTAKSTTLGFHGPFATISVGLGG